MTSLTIPSGGSGDALSERLRHGNMFELFSNVELFLEAGQLVFAQSNFGMTRAQTISMYALEHIRHRRWRQCRCGKLLSSHLALTLTLVATS